MKGKKKRFEKKAHLAWLSESQVGYRGTAQPEWKLLSLDELSADQSGPKSIDLTSALELESGAPPTKIEPMSGETVQVSSEVRLVIQRIDEDRPRVADNSTEVPYGTVVRVGSLLFAPLFEEQVESFREGTLELPRVAEAQDIAPDADADRVSLEISSALRLSKPSKWIVGVVVLLVLIVGGLVVWHFTRAQSEGEVIPERVLCVFSGWENTRHKTLRDNVDEALREFGFSPIVATSEDLDGPVSDVRELEPLARKNLAAQVLLMSIEVTKERPGLEKNRRYLFLKVSAQTHRVGGAIPSEPRSIDLGLQRNEEEESLVEAGGRALEPLLGGAVTELLRSPAITSEISISETEYIDQTNKTLLSAQAAALSREQGIERFDKACEETEERTRSSVGDTGRALTKGCGVEYPVGLLPDGSSAIVLVKTGEPYFLLETPAPVHWVNTQERLDVVPVDGSPRRVLSFAEEISGEAALSANGKSVLFIEKALSRYGLISVDVDSFERSVLHVTEPPARMADPLPSMDGRWILFKQSSGPRDPGWYRVLDVESGEIVDIPGKRTTRFDWVELDHPEKASTQTYLATLSRLPRDEIDDTTTMVMQMRLTARGTLRVATGSLLKHVEIIEPATGERVARLFDPDRFIEQVIGSIDGDLIMTMTKLDDNERLLCRYNLATKKLIDIPISRRLWDLRLTASGELVGVIATNDRELVNRNDRELVHVELEEGTLFRLTENSIQDGYPRPASKASRVLYSCRPWTSGRERSVCIAELPQ